MQLAMMMIAVAVTAAAPERTDDRVDCREYQLDPAMEATCARAVCPRELATYVGAWEGVVFRGSGESTFIERKLVFSAQACLRELATGDLYLVGRQEDFVARSSSSAGSVEHSLFVLVLPEKGGRPAVRVLGRYRVELAPVAGRPSSWSCTPTTCNEGIRRASLTGELNRARRVWPLELQVVFSGAPSHRERAHGQLTPAPDGEVSHFAAQTWLFGSEGSLLTVRSSLVKRARDPVTGIVRQHELQYSESGAQLHRGDSTRQVQSESIGLTVHTVVATQGLGNSETLHVVDVRQNGAAFSEERVLDSSGKATSVTHRVLSPLRRHEFQLKYRAVLKEHASDEVPLW